MSLVCNVFPLLPGVEITPGDLGVLGGGDVQVDVRLRREGGRPLSLAMRRGRAALMAAGPARDAAAWGVRRSVRSSLENAAPVAGALWAHLHVVKRVELELNVRTAADALALGIASPTDGNLTLGSGWRAGGCGVEVGAPGAPGSGVCGVLPGRFSGGRKCQGKRGEKPVPTSSQSSRQNGPWEGKQMQHRAFEGAQSRGDRAGRGQGQGQMVPGTGLPVVAPRSPRPEGGGGGLRVRGRRCRHRGAGGPGGRDSRGEDLRVLGTRGPHGAVQPEQSDRGRWWRRG